MYGSLTSRLPFSSCTGPVTQVDGRGPSKTKTERLGFGRSGEWGGGGGGTKQSANNPGKYNKADTMEREGGGG